MTDVEAPAAAPVAPHRMHAAGKRRLMALVLGVVAGACLGLVLGWRAVQPRASDFPHAGKGDYTDLDKGLYDGVSDEALEELTEAVLAGSPLAPSNAALEANPVSAESALPVHGIVDNSVSYRIEERMVVRGTKRYATNFLFVQNGTDTALRLQRWGQYDEEGTGVLASIPALGPFCEGVLWLGNADPAQSVTVEEVSETAGVLPDELKALYEPNHSDQAVTVEDDSIHARFDCGESLSWPRQAAVSLVSDMQVVDCVDVSLAISIVDGYQLIEFDCPLSVGAGHVFDNGSEWQIYVSGVRLSKP